MWVVKFRWSAALRTVYLYKGNSFTIAKKKAEVFLSLNCKDVDVIKTSHSNELYFIGHTENKLVSLHVFVEKE